MKMGSERWKKNLVKKYLCSGLSHSNFCRAEGINLSSFYNWRRRYEIDSGISKVEESRFIPIDLSDSDDYRE